MATAYVRNAKGFISPVNESDLKDHVTRPGMSLASLEDWLAQEGISNATTKESQEALTPTPKKKRGE